MILYPAGGKKTHWSDVFHPPSPSHLQFEQDDVQLMQCLTSTWLFVKKTLFTTMQTHLNPLPSAKPHSSFPRKNDPWSRKAPSSPAAKPTSTLFPPLSAPRCTNVRLLCFLSLKCNFVKVSFKFLWTALPPGFLTSSIFQPWIIFMRWRHFVWRNNYKTLLKTFCTWSILFSCFFELPLTFVVRNVKKGDG